MLFDALSIRRELAGLRKLANEACEAALHDEDCRQDTVNGGDFACVSAEFYVDEDSQGYRVRIEEADPSCPNVHRFVHEYLAAQGWPDVEVITEW